MAKLNYRGTLQDPKGKGIEVGLSVLSYRDEDLHVIFSPALDLFGYGHTDKEARQSFDETLEEFLRYTSNKGTLQAELLRMGWKARPESPHHLSDAHRPGARVHYQEWTAYSRRK